MIGIDDAVTASVDLISKVIDKIFPDPAAAADAKLKLLQLTQDGTLKELTLDNDLAKAGLDNVKTEAASTNWLASSWRPITMLCFVAIIVNNYILFPYLQLFGHAGIVLSLPPDMWGLLKIGMGGYVVGRSAEKILPSVLNTIKK